MLAGPAAQCTERHSLRMGTGKLHALVWRCGRRASGRCSSARSLRLSDNGHPLRWRATELQADVRKLQEALADANIVLDKVRGRMGQ